MLPRLLAWILAQAIGMGALHAMFARRVPFPHALFCGVSGILFAILGLVALGGPLVEHARLAAWTAAWIPAFGLGAFAAGLVLGAVWQGLVFGGAWWLQRRLGR